VAYGDLPGVGPLLRVALALAWDQARFEIEAHYAFVRRARFEDNSARGADLSQAFAVARGCGVLHHRAAKLEFPICAGFEGGAEFGQGVGFAEVEQAAIPWLAVDLVAGLVWAPLRNLALGLSIEPWVALTRPRFEVTGVGEIWRPLPVGVRALVGVETRF
jgi:hypothetical protein